LFKIVHQWAYLNYKLLSNIFSIIRVPKQTLLFLLDVKYIHSFYKISVSVYIRNHVIKLLSIRIEVIIDNNRGSADWGDRTIIALSSFSAASCKCSIILVSASSWEVCRSRIRITSTFPSLLWRHTHVF
jgi:hypothetical protein